MSYENLLSEDPKPTPVQPDISRAPWNEVQVVNLTKRQADINRHPYTCGTKDKHTSSMDSQILVPTASGWKCPSCDYTQDWCHLADTRTSFQNTVEFVVKHHEVVLTEEEKVIYDKLLD